MNTKAVSTVVEPSKSQLLGILGPGLITGASDDDHSGIATYSQTGAQFGFGLIWTMLFSYPLMSVVQEISGRTGRTTGRGIAGNMRVFYPNWLVQAVVALLLLANIHQHRRRSRRHRRCAEAHHRRPNSPLCRAVGRCLRSAADLPQIQSLRLRAKVADPVAVRLFRHGVVCPCAVERGREWPVHPQLVTKCRIGISTLCYDTGASPPALCVATCGSLVLVFGGPVVIRKAYDVPAF